LTWSSPYNGLDAASGKFFQSFFNSTDDLFRLLSLVEKFLKKKRKRCPGFFQNPEYN